MGSVGTAGTRAVHGVPLVGLDPTGTTPAQPDRRRAADAVQIQPAILVRLTCSAAAISHEVVFVVNDPERG
jgi:hypothetical protein